MSDLRKAADPYIRPGTVVPVNIETTKILVDLLRQALAQPDEVLTEREACAKVCEERGIDAFDNNDLIYNECAELIRAREKNT